MPRKTHATPANDINIPRLIFLLRFEEVIPGFTKVYMVWHNKSYGKSQFLALQFLLLFFKVIFLYLFRFAASRMFLFHCFN